MDIWWKHADPITKVGRIERLWETTGNLHGHFVGTSKWRFGSQISIIEMSRWSDDMEHQERQGCFDGGFGHFAFQNKCKAADVEGYPGRLQNPIKADSDRQIKDAFLLRFTGASLVA